MSKLEETVSSGLSDAFSKPIWDKLDDPTFEY
jgi:hypothetical protein